MGTEPVVEWPHVNFWETRARDAMATQNHSTRRHMWTLNTTNALVAHGELGTGAKSISVFAVKLMLIFKCLFRTACDGNTCSDKMGIVST